MRLAASWLRPRAARLALMGLTCAWLGRAVAEPGGSPERPAELAPDTRLVSGAPLADPNVAVHIVEAKAHPDQGALEVVLFPLVVQLNGKFTQHLGTMGAVVWHLHENFALQITGGGNWSAAESSFNDQLANQAWVQPQAATSLLWTWGVMGGVEVAPVYGKFAFLEDTLVHFELVLSGAAGVGGTSHQLKPVTRRLDETLSAASFGDTGTRFLGSLGAGLRIRLGRSFALRLEVRDVVYTARVSSVNGCSGADLSAMDAQLEAGNDLESTPVRASCQISRFTGKTGAGDPRSTDINFALNLVNGDNGVPSSDVLNNVGLYLGASFVF